MKKPVRDIFDQPSIRFSHAPGSKSRLPSRITERPPHASDRSTGVTARPPRATARAPQGARDLRRALVLLVKKLEAMGIDCSDVTEIIGDTES